MDCLGYLLIQVEQLPITTRNVHHTATQVAVNVTASEGGGGGDHEENSQAVRPGEDKPGSGPTTLPSMINLWSPNSILVRILPPFCPFPAIEYLGCMKGAKVWASRSGPQAFTSSDSNKTRSHTATS